MLCPDASAVLYRFEPQLRSNDEPIRVICSPCHHFSHTARNIIAGVPSAVAGIGVERRRPQDRISAATSTIPSQGAKFIVALQNTSDDDFVLNLGVVVANGKAMLPSAVHLLLTDRIIGRTIELQFCGGARGLSSRRRRDSAPQHESRTLRVIQDICYLILEASVPTGATRTRPFRIAGTARTGLCSPSALRATD
jgi:hypothetical protein